MTDNKTINNNNNNKTINVTHIVVRLKLADGTVREFTRPSPSKSSVPSKRANKNGSGRNGRRMYNGQQSLRAVGGRSSIASAIYAGSDKEAKGTICTNYYNLCKVVSNKDRNFTADPQHNQRSRDLGGRGLEA